MVETSCAAPPLHCWIQTLPGLQSELSYVLWKKREYQVDVYQQGLLNVTYFCRFCFISVELYFFCSLRQAVNCPSTLMLQIHILAILLCLAERRRKPFIFRYQHLWSVSKRIWTTEGVKPLCATWLKMNEEAAGLWENTDQTPLFKLAPIPKHPLMFPLTALRNDGKRAD